MKILTALLISLPLICTPLAANADKGGNKGPSDRAWERANDNASFKRGDDDRYKHYDKSKKKDGDHVEHYRDGDDRYGDRDRDRDRDRDNDDRDSSAQDDQGSRDPNRDRDRDRNRSGDDNQDNRVLKSIKSGDTKR